MREIKFPEDELPHKNQAIEWWYFNGFLHGKKDYAFMTCLFKADTSRINLSFLRLPFRNVYFSHSVLFDLKNKKVQKEVLPIVALSKDSFKRKNLFINYYYPLRKDFFDYEISREKAKLRLRTKYFDLLLKEKKIPLLENGNGFIDLEGKSTYYYSYSNLDAEGYIGREHVKGKAWHDRQWSAKGFMKDSWTWFSFQLPDNTEIVCFDYKGKKLATISYPSGMQETLEPEFKALGNIWKSRHSGAEYELEWKIKIGKFSITTKPIIKDCEIHFGTMHYWEGPIDVNINGIKTRGFMESLAPKSKFNLKNFLEKVENIPFDVEKIIEKSHLFD